MLLERSRIESLPQDVLIKILCCVDHYDLKQLMKVSTPIKEATSVAKRVHFAFSTPSKKVGVRRSFGELDDREEAPNAPKQRKRYQAIDEKKLAEISIALFSSPKKGCKKPWRYLFMTQTKA